MTFAIEWKKLRLILIRSYPGTFQGSDPDPGDLHADPQPWVKTTPHCFFSSQLPPSRGVVLILDGNSEHVAHA